MTAQDVAVVIAADDLVTWLKDPMTAWAGMTQSTNLDGYIRWLEEKSKSAAAHIEFQAQALREVEARLSTAYRVKAECNLEANFERRRFLAAESRLAEAMRVIEQCRDALSRCYDVTEWPADGSASQDEALTAARDFLNAANARANQEQTDA